MIWRVEVIRGERDLRLLTRLTPPNTLRSRLRNATGLRPRRFRTVLALACTGHGASIALATSAGTIRSSVLDRWAGAKHVLLLSRDEDRDIRNPVTELDRQIRYLLSFGFGKFPPTRVFEDVIVEWTDWFLRDLDITRSDIDLVVTSNSHFATCEMRLADHLHRWFPRAWFSYGIEHHEIHQRQAFWQSGFEEAAVLTLDACGEVLPRLAGRALAGTISAMDARGRCRVLKNIFFPESSPGLLYDVVNRHVGFKLGDEGKTMGLAPYGERSDLLANLERRLHLHDDGSYDFISHHELENYLHDYVLARLPEEELKPEHMNVAYAGQALLEKIVENAFHAALRLTGLRKIAYAGGVALNSVANDIAFRSAAPDALYVAPNPGDPGHALGCALFGAYEVARWPAPRREVPEYLGPTYTDRELSDAAWAAGYPVAEGADVAEELAQCIANGYIVARFAGGAEFGPRALGNRSILCDPRPAGMKDYLNDRVKHREGFRPFAPAVLEEDAEEWFEMSGRSAYMLRVVRVRPERSEQIAATVHVDGTGRVQTVSPSDNRGFYDVIRAFKELTGVPVVLNTSFNVAGKPIVETPRDAVECFAGTDIDVLALGSVLVSKRPLSVYRAPRADHATPGAPLVSADAAAPTG
jgi:carbamoyltransferase